MCRIDVPQIRRELICSSRAEHMSGRAEVWQGLTESSAEAGQHLPRCRDHVVDLRFNFEEAGEIGENPTMVPLRSEAPSLRETKSPESASSEPLHNSISQVTSSTGRAR